MLVNALPALSQTAWIAARDVSLSGNFLEKVTFLRHVEEEIDESWVNSTLIFPKPKSGTQGAPAAKINRSFSFSLVVVLRCSSKDSFTLLSSAVGVLNIKLLFFVVTEIEVKVDRWWHKTAHSSMTDLKLGHTTLSKNTNVIIKSSEH